MKHIFYILFIILFVCCNKQTKTDKIQIKRDSIVNIKNRIKEIKIDSILFSSISKPYLISDFLLIADFKAHDECIHIFNKNNFHYVKSFAYTGPGPDEITRLGYVGINEMRREIELTDLGKQEIYYYNLDSLLYNNLYTPSKKSKIIGEKLIHYYQYIDTITKMGLILTPNGTSNYSVSVGTQNTLNREFKTMPYTHPYVNNKRVYFDVSPQKEMYVECYQGQDLMSICSIDGTLKYNIYGGYDWKENQKGRKEYYRPVRIVGDKIFALYLNNAGIINHPTKGLIGNTATQFLVFDLSGDYLFTLETEYHITNFCYDESNNRLILACNDDIQFGYLSLKDIP